MRPAHLVPATRADLDALPRNVVGEIIDGVLYAFPRPRPRHAKALLRLSSRLELAYDQGVGGPGGWVILAEPGIELPRSPEVVPDIAGWRIERLGELDLDARLTEVPDWVCEVLSPSNRRHDLITKKPYYASIGVRWLWIADSAAREVTAYRLGADGLWSELATFGDSDMLRVEPFDAIEIDVSTLWDVGPAKSPVAD